MSSKCLETKRLAIRNGHEAKEKESNITKKKKNRKSKEKNNKIKEKNNWIKEKVKAKSTNSRKTRYSSSRSSSSDACHSENESSLSDSSEEGDFYYEYHRFSTKTVKNNRCQSKSMKKYAKKMFLKHIPNTDLKEIILSLNTVPSKLLCK